MWYWGRGETQCCRLYLHIPGTWAEDDPNPPMLPRDSYCLNLAGNASEFRQEKRGADGTGHSGMVGSEALDLAWVLDEWCDEDSFREVKHRPGA